MEMYRPCPICDSISIENIKRISFRMEGIMPDYYFLAKCNKCGFVYANTPATMEDYERYYAENNRYSNLPTQDKSSRKAYEKAYGLISKYIDKDDMVLDIGCGSGKMLKYMKDDGYINLTGLDPSQESIDDLISNGLSTIKGSVYDKPETDKCGKFDAIILSGVLEHLYDLKSVMQNIILYLKPEGKVLCFVPNALEYYLYPLPLSNYINIEHINHFSPNAIARLFFDNKLSMLECNSVGIDFGVIPDPTLLLAFEYTDVEDIISKNVVKMLKQDQLRQVENNRIIDELVKSFKPIVIFGTGNLARTLVSNTDLLKANIIFFVDNDVSTQGKTFCDYQVKSPNYLKAFEGDILILSMHGYKEIEEQIREMDLLNKTIVLGREE